ncbi:hypothetical protein B0A48_16982 [Cryoendolithus antarcticus]|uniref:Nuclear segregation protein n=2 Tax=Cryoendolithus antarcticus TaxID=1507870 RepID=A0A1V8SCV1_9PEZI|nr:hypothetical protein B0A48_16982 [Cryoendolithus antarcticus]
MADLATPSAATISTSGASKTAVDSKDKAPVVKPERPDEEAYKTELTKAEKDLKTAEERMKAIKSKVDSARPNNKDSPSAQRQQELREELKTIRTTQQSSKSSRGQVLDKIKRLDENLKARIAEQKLAKSKVPFKNVAEIDDQINRLQKQVDAGTMKIVDEKKALSEVSQLNRQKKGFASFDQAEKGITDVKNQIAELKKGMDDPAARALSDRYTEITTELDKIKAEQDDVFKNINTLRDERNKAHEDQQKKYVAVKEIKDRYFSARRAAQDYEREARRIRDEKRRVENDTYHRGRRQEAAKEKLEDASAPAYADEIRTTQTLLAHFDPSSVAKREAAGPGKFAAAASRKVDDSALKGTKISSKKANDDDAYFIGGGGKKKKGGRNASTAEGTSPAPTTPSEGKFNLDIGTIENLGRIGVDPPMQSADVPAVVEKLKEKLAFWKENQDKKTKENVAKAQAEIDRLEAEAAAANEPSSSRNAESSSKRSAPEAKTNGHANGDAENGDAAQEIAADLEQTKIENGPL